jgi:hypothetical protein
VTVADPIPALSPPALGGMALLLMALGAVLVRRLRPQTL